MKMKCPAGAHLLQSEHLEYYRLRWLNNLQQPLMEWMDIEPPDLSNPNLEWRAGKSGPLGEPNWPLTEEMFGGPLRCPLAQ